MTLSLIAISSLLSVGALTVLSVQTELRASGQGRFGQGALYAAESGAYAAIDFLRGNCETADMFTKWISPGNSAVQSPAGILGNKVQPGQNGYVFGADETDLWYEVQVLNNSNDPGFAAGKDTDGIVVLRSTGHGENQSTATVRVTVQNNSCLAAFCAQEYAQRDVGERNTSSVACSQRVTSGTLRTAHP